MTGAQRSRVGEASGYVGSLAARRPCAVIWGMVFWSLLMTMGLATMKVQTDGLYLWIPTQSSPYKNMLDMIDRFGPFRRNQILILYPKSGDNILTEENLKGVLDVHEDIAFNIVSDEKKVSFEDSAPPAPSARRAAPTRAPFPRPRRPDARALSAAPTARARPSQSATPTARAPTASATTGTRSRSSVTTGRPSPRRRTRR